ncbi:MAG: ABC transporter permease, partial [Myxococcales bacterium]|nr:ABC transporter permease [Myxococcales bacterium]
SGKNKSLVPQVLLALVASAAVGYAIVEVVARAGVLAVAFGLMVAWPVYSTVKKYRREVEQAKRSRVELKAVFPVGRFVGIFIAGAALTWLYTLAADFFPAPVSGFSTALIEQNGRRVDFASNVTSWTYLKDILTHMVLPTFCLTYASLAYLSRYARTGLLDVIQSDYIRTARAKGLSEPVVILKHAVRNGMIPILTLLASTLPALVGGSIVIEYIFGIPGIGNLILDATIQKDFNVVMGVLQISAVMTLLGILLSDISYALVDPRITFD